MIKYDYHTHTSHSFDSNASMKSMIERAIAIGLEEIAITDHIDFTWPECEIISPLGIAANMKAIQAVWAKYAGKIKVLAGIELGLRPDLAEVGRKIVAEHDFDIVIGSAHEIDGIDFYYGHWYQGRPKHAAYMLYFENLLATVQACDCYDVLGHLDYVERYGRYDDKSLHHGDYQEVIDEILKTVIQKGKGIEINTSGYANGLGHPHPQMPGIKRFVQLGGEVITVGSDAHAPGRIAGNFDDVYKILQSLGIKYITRFDKRHPQFVKI